MKPFVNESDIVLPRKPPRRDSKSRMEKLLAEPFTPSQRKGKKLTSYIPSYADNKENPSNFAKSTKQIKFILPEG